MRSCDAARDEPAPYSPVRDVAPSQARAVLVRALALQRELGDRRRFGESLGLNLMGAGKLAEAADNVRESLAQARLAGDPVTEAYALNALGDLDRHRGAHDEARVHYLAALDVVRRFGLAPLEVTLRKALDALDARARRPS